jgi:vitamin B12 transporter
MSVFLSPYRTKEKHFPRYANHNGQTKQRKASSMACFPFICLILLFSPIKALSQNSDSFTLKGSISDTAAAPLPYCYVQIDALSIGTITDDNGMYELKNIPPGTYTVAARFLGFITETKTITGNRSQTANLDFILKEDVKAYNDAVIIAETDKQVFENSAQAVDVIETKEVKLQTIDMGEVLAQTQGVGVRRSGGLGSNAQFSLNGLSGDKIRIFMDGIPLEYNGQVFGISNIPVTLVDRIEIYKGVVPIQFGADALGGAVNIVSPKILPGLHVISSYQAGSFGTHRIASEISYAQNTTGFFFSGGGFYDYAKNNYKVDVDVPNEKGKLSEVTVKRFHDTYQAGGLNLTCGIRNKNWAKELSLKVFHTSYEKDLQHNNFMTGIPYGKVVTFRKSTGINLSYQKDFGDKVSLNIYSGYNHSQRKFIDTSHNVYNWYGEVILTRIIPGELPNEPASHLITLDKTFYARVLPTWNISKNHVLRFSISPTSTLRTGDEKFAGSYDPNTNKGNLLTWINGIEYQFNALNKRLENILFIKDYYQKLESEAAITNGGSVTTKREVHYYGFGNGIRYKFSNQFLIKASYEYATRLARPDEVFGDGIFVTSNPDLKPERSHNVNFALHFKNSPAKKALWEIQINSFLRKVENLILLIPANDPATVYKNVHGANSTGVEVSGSRTSANDKINVTVNSTYQHFYNSSKDGLFGTFYKDRIPNTPYFFANASASYSFKKLLSKTDRLTFFFTTRYAHHFFFSWESAGRDKTVIPRQNINNAGITYKFLIDKINWALTGEIQNLTNEKNYDFYGVQKPGRAFYVKLTVQL